MTQAPRPKHGVTLRTFLSGLIWLSVFPLLLLGAWLAWDSQRSTMASQEESARRLASNFMTAVDKYLDVRMRALDLLAATPMLDDPERWPEFYVLAQSFQRHFEGHVILAEADEPRRMLLNTRAPLGAQLPVLPRAEQQSTVSMAIELGRPAVGDIVFGPVAGEPLNCIAAPVMRSGELVFILVSTYSTNILQNQTDKFELPPDWIMHLRDGSGNIIARHGPPDFAVHEDAPSKRRFVVQSAVGPWFAELEIPDQVFHSLRFQAVIPILLGLLVTAFVGISGARLAGNRLQRAMASLVGPQPIKPAARITEIEGVRELLATSQEELRHSELYFKRLFENAPVALALSNPEGAILKRNARFDELSGYSAAETPDWNGWWSRVCPEPEIHAQVMTDWKTAITHLDAPPVEHRIRRKDGTERIVQVFSVQFDNGFLSSFLDFTDQRHAENELRIRHETKLVEQAEMRTALLNQMQDANAARERAEKALVELRQSNALLIKAEQLALLGSWTLDVTTGSLIWCKRHNNPI